MKFLLSVALLSVMATAPALATITAKDESVYEKCHTTVQHRSKNLDDIIAKCSTCAMYLYNHMNEVDGEEANLLKLYSCTCFEIEGLAERADGQEALGSQNLVIADAGFMAIVRYSTSPALISQAKSQIANLKDQ